jgi:hypothetical protein
MSVDKSGTLFLLTVSVLSYCTTQRHNLNLHHHENIKSRDFILCDVIHVLSMLGVKIDSIETNLNEHISLIIRQFSFAALTIVLPQRHKLITLVT